MKTMTTQRQKAFTLVEAMVAVAILSLIIAMIYGTFFSVLNVTKTGSDAAEKIQRERVALNTIEAALSGIVYYEQNQDRYAFMADTVDYEYPIFSFVSRVPPDFIGSKEFGAQTLRRIEFAVEDDEVHGKSLVMYQNAVLHSADTFGNNDFEDRRRWLLNPGLDYFHVFFWSTSVNDWIPEWDQTNSVPARLKFEMAVKPADDTEIELSDIHKREIMIYAQNITQGQQSPPLPRGSGRGNNIGSSNRRPTASQLADWRRRRESSGSRGSSSRGNSSSGRSDAQRAQIRQQMIDRFRRMREERGNSGSSGRSPFPGFSPGGQAGNPAGGGNSSGGGNAGPGPGGAGGIPGQSAMNNALQQFFLDTGNTASSIGDLDPYFDDDYPQPNPPAGTEWYINSETQQVMTRVVP